MADNEAIKRALDRERRARKESEKILEEKSRQLFESNEQLLKLNSSLEKQVADRTEEINKSAEQLEILFDNNPIPIIIYDLKTYFFLAVNQTAIDNYGYSRAEFLSMNLADLYPSGALTPEEAHNNIVRTENSESTEWQHKTKHNGLIDVEISSAPIKFYTHSAWMVSIKDITEQKEALRSLVHNEAKYRELVESTSDIIFRCDEHGVFTYVNPTCEHVTEHGHDELLTMNYEDLVHPQHLERIKKFYQKQLSSGLESSYIEYPILTKSGREVWLGQTVDWSIEDGQGIEIRALCKDISKQKKIEQELMEAKELAESSVQSKEIFMANMSHEIRTPMNAIVGMSEILSKSVLNEKQKEFLNAIKTSADNLLIIINDILDFSKIEAGKLDLSFTPVDLNQLLNDCVRTVELKAEEKGLMFDLQIGHNVGVYAADPTRLGQIVINLLSNAVKFTHEGKVTLICNRLEGNAESDRLHFSVLDTGIGIEDAKLEKIFESFSQAEESTTRKYGGTGLGLAISQELVLKMGGQLQVESKLGKGTRFYFDIDLTKDVLTEQLAVDRVENKDALKGKRVLLVEDNEINRFMAQTILENWSCEVINAHDGQKALDYLSENKADIVLMDMRMPVMDGIKATTCIRQELKLDVPIIGLTANALKGDSVKCLEVGMNDYISKPFKQEELKRKMIELIDASAELDLLAVTKDMSNTGSGLVDLQTLEMSTNGDQAFMKKMISLFINDTSDRIEQLEAAIQADDSEVIGKIAHSIKPSIDHVAVQEMKDLVRHLENGGTDHKDLLESTMAFSAKLTVLCKELEGRI